ncbi:MAG: hypothetical protein NPIRA02_08100 [Nitrospirales bacterium]|nr:MAG: hypothetical protein NPIRA02_08100 [Nitrospirales bacterium]
MNWVMPRSPLLWLSFMFSCTVLVLIGHAAVSVGSDSNNAHILQELSQPPTEFSAMCMWRKDGKTSKAQVFVKGDRYRLEHWGGLQTDLGLAGVTIVRLDLQQVWYIYSQRRLVLSVPAEARDVLPYSVILDGEVRRTFIGDAEVGVQPAQLYEVEVVSQNGQYERYYEWVDPERQVLLKLLSQDRDWRIEYDHVVLSTQPDYFFEPPLGYRTIEAQRSDRKSNS